MAFCYEVLLIVVACSDANWAGCRDSCRSTIYNWVGMQYVFSPNVIVWCSKKQPTISESSTEAEYRVVAYTAAETVWIRKLLYDLGITLTSPVRMCVDNVSATYLTTNPVHHDRSKHIAVDYHLVHEHFAHGDLVVRHVPTRLQLADIFTKGLSSQQFLFHRSNLSM